MKPIISKVGKRNKELKSTNSEDSKKDWIDLALEGAAGSNPINEADGRKDNKIKGC